jgi:hypothetical protein
MKTVVIALAIIWCAGVGGAALFALSESSWDPPPTVPKASDVAGKYVGGRETLVLAATGAYDYWVDTPRASVASRLLESGHWVLPELADGSRMVLRFIPNGAAVRTVLAGDNGLDVWLEQGWFGRFRLAVGGDEDNARYLDRSK